jgi:class 3 adenylate cyclase/tetratricopeptide (TPR) repeat protein
MGVDFGAWLRGLGLGKYVEVLEANAIGGDVLGELTDAELKELGMKLGDRKRLLKAAAALGPPPAAATAAGVAASAGDGVESSGERRQVAILFADLAGYTALSREVDAEEVHALLERFFACADRLVTEHGGRVDKHIGDCVMAVFGAPVAHGNDAERAVRAALAIQEAMPALATETGRPVLVHIGIAGGEVVAGGTGSAAHREYTVTGDSVNLAARLTDAARAGEILLSAAVHGALLDRLECEAVAPLAVKGFAGAVPAWRLHGIRERSGLDHRRSLVGRDAEIGLFRAIIAAVAGSGRGRAVLVRGEAGIGKTRLVEAFQDAAAAEGFISHAGLVLDFGASTGRDAIRTLVRGLLGIDDRAGVTEAGEAASRAIGAHGLVAEADAVFLNDLLGLPQPDALKALYNAMDNASRNDGKRLTVAKLVEAASARTPRLLVVEDLHWADRLTLTHLARLTATVADCPALLVMTTRNEGDPLDRAWLAGAGASPLFTIDLGPLDPAAARTLAAPFLAANAALAERCVERAAGNPLFLEHLLRHAEEGSDVAVPGSVRSLVQARCDRLGPADKAALQAASVLGQLFDAAILAHLLEQPGYVADGLVANLLVRPQAGGGYLFAHALIRDAVYDGLLKSRRRELHGRAAAWFKSRDPVLHAEHLDRAEDAAAPRAYFAAAQAQAAVYHYDAALRLVRRGLDRAVEPADQLALALFEGDILHDLGVMPEALVAYDRALGAAASDAERCRAWIGLAAVKRVTDDIDGALGDLARAEAAAEGQGLVVEAARIHGLRGNLCFPRGDIDGCLREHGLALDLARRAQAYELEAAALGGLGDAEYVRGRMISAHARLSECVELARRHGFGRIEVANLAQIAHTMVYFRPQWEAARQALAAVDAATRVGHLRAEMNARAAAVFALANVDDAAGCREQAEEGQRLVRMLGAWRFEPSWLRHLGLLALRGGRVDEAVDLLRQAVEVCRRNGLPFEGPRTLSALALAVGEPVERRAHLAEGEAIIRAGCVGHNPLYFYPDAIDVCLELGDAEEVERFAAALAAFTRPEPLPWADFHVARGRALAAWGSGDRDDAVRTEIERLKGDAQRAGLLIALPRLEAALASG